MVEASGVAAVDDGLCLSFGQQRRAPERRDGRLVVVVPIGAGLAVSRYHLYDVDRILSRAITYLIVTSCVAGTYLAVVVVVAYAIGQAANRSMIATTAGTLAAIVAARPIYDAVRDELDRRFQRGRYEAIRQVRAFVAAPPHDRRVEQVLQQAFGDSGLRVAVLGRSPFALDHLRPGATEVATRRRRHRRARWAKHRGSIPAATTPPPYEPCSTRRHRNWTTLGSGPRSLPSSRRSAASRERIAAAQIHERRRIERDLHDGAQQRLLGAAAQMQAALLNGNGALGAALELGVCESRDHRDRAPRPRQRITPSRA